ncbi:hypothetical protein [Ruminococcus sp.]|uniref:hypothetical protein n=1 Tax=Ruminococcus sp. TaxID=41978 RepID=UPI003F08A4FC
MKNKKIAKRALSLLIVMLMLASLVPFGTISASAVEDISGDGTPGNPYLIGTPEGLKKFSETVNGGQYGAYAKLISDIEINPGIECGTSGYLGDKEPEENKYYIIKYFEGVFDGQGHTISGLYSNEFVREAGLFYHPTGAVIKNLNIDRSYIKSFLYGGMISVATDTTVINCHSNAYYDSYGEEIEIGGIAGQAYNSKFISCTNTGQITSYHYHRCEQRFGGIVGLAENSTFVDCKNTGKLDANEYNMGLSFFGGIVGDANNCSISHCTNDAILAPLGKVMYDTKGVGGIVGSLKGESSVIGCINSGIIYEDSGGKTAGGLIGKCPYNSYKESKIRDCLNTGTVYIGDISLNTFIGNMYYANISIDNCFTRGCFVHYLTADVYSKLKISNSYYEDREVRYTTSYGEYKTELNNTIQYTDEMRTSGEIAYNLNKKSSSVKIGQDLAAHQYYPSINGKKVYYGYENCQSTEKTYSNDFRYEIKGIGHIYDEKGICTLCGASGGSEESPYPISTAEDLRSFADAVNNGATALCAKLLNDIDLNPGTTFNIADGTYTGDEPTKWTPMGTTEYPYCGTFDGAGYKISGLYTDDSNAFSGLFGNCAAADNKAPVIKNLSVDNSSISANNVAGGIAAYISNGTVSNCSSSDDVFIHSSSTGGIAGNSANCEISDCSNSSAVTGRYKAGGIIGEGSANTISKCFNSGVVTVQGLGASYAGGISGYESGGSQLSDVYNTGDIYLHYGITSASPYDIGGIIGYGECSITNGYNTGSLNSIWDGAYASIVFKGAAIGYAGSTSTEIKNYYYSDASLVLCSGANVTSENTGVKTAEQLASGEVAYLLNGQTSDGDLVWGQMLGIEETPVFSSETVYYGTNCAGESLYSNLPVTADHHFISLDGKCYICGAYEDEMSALYGYSATLGGNIGLNFIMEIDEEYRNDDTSMNFSVVYNDSETDEQKELYTQSVPFKDAQVITVDGKNYYKFTCNVAAKEMTCAIKGHLVNGDKQGTEFTSSVADYAYTLLYSENATDSTQKLVKAMLNYGAYSQEYFKFYTDYLANCDLSDEEKQLNEYYASDYSYYKSEYKQINENTDIGYYGSSLVLEANTEVKNYFTFDSTKTNFDDITYTCTDSLGEEYEADIESKQWGDNGFYVKITDIPPHLYSKRLTVTVSAGGEEQCSLSFTPISYFYSVLNAYPEDDGVHDSLRNVVKAYYQYGLEAYGYKVNS